MGWGAARWALSRRWRGLSQPCFNLLGARGCRWRRATVAAETVQRCVINSSTASTPSRTQGWECAAGSCCMKGRRGLGVIAFPCSACCAQLGCGTLIFWHQSGHESCGQGGVQVPPGCSGHVNKIECGILKGNADERNKKTQGGQPSCASVSSERRRQQRREGQQRTSKRRRLYRGRAAAMRWWWQLLPHAAPAPSVGTPAGKEWQKGYRSSQAYQI